MSKVASVDGSSTNEGGDDVRQRASSIKVTIAISSDFHENRHRTLSLLQHHHHRHRSHDDDDTGDDSNALDAENASLALYNNFTAR